MVMMLMMILGHTALGGSYEKRSQQEPDEDLAERIMRRAIRVCPDLVPAGAGIESLRVIRHQVGFRPYREGGPRVETERLTSSSGTELKVVHAYGVGGTGYQVSHGVAEEVISLITNMFMDDAGPLSD